MGDLVVGHQPYRRRDTNDRPITELAVADEQTLQYRSASKVTHQSVSRNSDNQRGAQMSRPQIARDEEIRCVSPQRLVAASSASRVLSFRSPVTMSDADRLRLLDEHDPAYAAMIRRLITRGCDRLTDESR